jgi:hypothetical protein
LTGSKHWKRNIDWRGIKGKREKYSEEPECEALNSGVICKCLERWRKTQTSRYFPTQQQKRGDWIENKVI